MWAAATCPVEPAEDVAAAAVDPLKIAESYRLAESSVRTLALRLLQQRWQRQD